MKGLFITIEGPDGTGKSTQAKLLKLYFEKLGRDVILIREPGGCSICEQIRETILSNENTEMDNMTEALLYAASRAQLTKEVIIPAIENGKIVICDRYIHSSIAYQGYARGLGKEMVLDINKYALFNIWPDFTIFLDMEVRSFRLGKKRDRIEGLNKKFFEDVLLGFRQLYKDDENRNIVIDANLKKKDIHLRIIKELKERVPEIGSFE